MRWQGRRESQNIEDRRGDGGGAGGGFGGGFPGLPGGSGRGGGGPIRIGGGKGGIAILIVAVIVLWFLGINPLTLLEGGLDPTSSGPGQVTRQAQAPQPGGQQTAANDEMKRFVAVVLAETEDVWTDLFRASGETYEYPTLVLFSGQVQSACGFASAASGPFYCPGDRKVFLDTAFFQELGRRFGAPGDFAEAYVIAHEVGHHVQNLIGVLPKFNEMRGSMSEAAANAMSVKVELQADCFAGVWANHTDKKGILEPGDVEEALNAAQQIGDDTLQKRTQGYVVPESFNHGTSAQRVRWFKKGFETGDPNSCDTFGAQSL